jgi:hypothetical protein
MINVVSHAGEHHRKSNDEGLVTGPIRCDTAEA